MTIVLAALLVSVIVALAFFAVLVRMRPAADWTPDPVWLNRFSLTKYRPMERLLLETDYQFLAAQAGYTPDLANTLRAERRRIFRAYLRRLARDFMRLHAVARWVLARSAQDRPEMGMKLVRQQIDFLCIWFLIEARLALHVGSVDVAPLVRTVEAFRLQLGELAPSATPA
jgi:hypothetical protein